jgi:hypothetical protein
MIDAPDDVLHCGDRITLEAEIDTEMEGLRLQWQVATKPAEELKENEREWEDIPGAHGLRHTFTVKEGMQTWRWRLRIRLPDGEMMYSDELMLPPMQEAEPKEAISDAAKPLDLPVAHITLMAGVPEEEITFGTQIELIAEIENPHEGMLLQWQFMPAEEELAEDAWRDVPGATGSTHAYMLGEENEGWLWRLLVTMPEALDGAPESAEGEMLSIEDAPAEGD